MRSMAGVTHLQEFEGHAKYGATSYKGRMGERQDKQVAGDACCPYSRLHKKVQVNISRNIVCE